MAFLRIQRASSLRRAACPQVYAFLLGGAVCGAAVLYFLFVFLHPTRPEWMVLLDDSPSALMDPDKEFPCLKGEPFKKIVYINNIVLRRPVWREADVQELLEIQRPGYPKSIHESGRTPAEEQAYFVFSAANSSLGVRLEVGAPVEPAAKELIVQHWLSELEEKFPERRVDAGLDLLFGKFIEERPIRLAVERLLDDPDEDVRHTMALQLSRYDDSKQRSLEYEARKQAGANQGTLRREAP